MYMLVLYKYTISFAIVNKYISYFKIKKSLFNACLQDKLDVSVDNYNNNYLIYHLRNKKPLHNAAYKRSYF